MTDLIDTTEMYLRTILDLEEENIVPLRARISERLGHSGPTVSQTDRPHGARRPRRRLRRPPPRAHRRRPQQGRARDAQAPSRRASARRRHRPRLGVRARRGLPLGARDERAGRAPLARAARPPDRVAVRQPDPRPRRARRQPAGAAFIEGVINLVERRRRRGRARAPASSVASASRCSSSRNCSQQLQAVGRACPARPATFSAAGSYVLVQVDGFGEGLELPNEVASHIFVTARDCRNHAFDPPKLVQFVTIS